jgi:pyridoxal phosphate enzyme (YggS family)
VLRVRSDVAAAARRSRRDPASVTLVGVTKSVGAGEAGFLVAAGVLDLGENRPEDLLAKSRDPGLSAARWHLIGTYQRRKVKGTLAPIAVIHSVHSIALAEALSAEARRLGRRVDCLIQVNVSGEASKQGFGAAEARPAFDRLRTLDGLAWRGLMTMAPAGASPDAARRVFADARELRDALRDAELPLPDLSMGMSADYVEAVLEGSTLIRVGTALFDMASGEPAS